MPGLQTLSVYVPLPLPGFTTAERCTGRPDGMVTTQRFMVTWSPASNEAMPAALALLTAPH